jgi:hypothetical protein
MGQPLNSSVSELSDDPVDGDSSGVFPTCSEFLSRHASAISSYDCSRSRYPCMIVAIMISSAPVRWASAWSPAFTVDGEPAMWEEKSSVTYRS